MRNFCENVEISVYIDFDGPNIYYSNDTYRKRLAL